MERTPRAGGPGVEAGGHETKQSTREGGTHPETSDETARASNGPGVPAGDSGSPYDFFICHAGPDKNGWCVRPNTLPL